MRILLSGRNGQIGWELERKLAPLGEVIPTDRAALDLADPDQIRRVVREVKPEVIVNAAAYTAVDKAESEPELAMKINGTAPGILAQEAKRLSALLVHYSTDYVFDGAKESAYREDEAPNPLNVYGKTKLSGEEAIVKSDCRHLILRTSWVYGARGKNFLLAILRKARGPDALRVVADQIGTPTSAALVAEATAVALARTVESKELEGLYHVAAAGETSWHGFARAIVSGVGSPVTVISIASCEYAAAAARPGYSVLDTTKFRHAFAFALPHWTVDLGRVLGALLERGEAHAPDC